MLTKSERPKAQTAVTVAIQTALRPGAEKLLCPPVATRSSKPESQAAEVAEKKARQVADAKNWPITATVVACVILGDNGNVIFDGTIENYPAEGELAMAAIRLIEDVLFLRSPLETETERNRPLDASMIFGDDIWTTMRILFADACRYGTIIDKIVDLRKPFWAGTRMSQERLLADPYETFVASDRRGDISRQTVVDYLQPPRIREISRAGAEMYATKLRTRGASTDSVELLLTLNSQAINSWMLAVSIGLLG